MTTSVYKVTPVSCIVPADAVPVPNAFFGQGTGPIFLNNVVCGTTVNRLINCSFDLNPAGRTHADDAGVNCTVTRMWMYLEGN